MLVGIFATSAATLDLEIPLGTHVLESSAQLGIQFVVTRGPPFGCPSPHETQEIIED